MWCVEGRGAYCRLLTISRGLVDWCWGWPSMADTLTIDKSSLDVRAAAAIRQQIVVGVLVPGTRLTEMKLAGDLALSRGRFGRRCTCWWARGWSSRCRMYTGWAVARLGPRDLWELYTLRSSLEGLAARLVAESIDEQRAARLAQVFDDLVGACQSGNPLLVAESDFALHTRGGVAGGAPAALAAILPGRGADSDVHRLFQRALAHAAGRDRAARAPDRVDRARRCRCRRARDAGAYRLGGAGVDRAGE